MMLATDEKNESNEIKKTPRNILMLATDLLVRTTVPGYGPGMFTNPTSSMYRTWKFRTRLKGNN
jgi:hypothetical protein